MAVDDDRRRTAGARRARIIEALSREFDVTEPTSAVSRLKVLLNDPPRPMIVSGDIDGVVSAAMLAQVAGWRAVAVVVKSDTVWLHPDVSSGALDLASCFGVDVFGSYFPNVSNHVGFWGSKRPGSSNPAAAAAAAHDEEIRRRGQDLLFANPSLWTGIEGSYPEAGARPASAGYRYPLGTAQVLLALLEAAGRPPRMFDRDYLPWLVAHCDGGLKTIREYPYNVPMWWSCLAAAVGPASLSESLYQLAMTQRPLEFIDAVNRLRTERGDDPSAAANNLDDDWNLRTYTLPTISTVADWITSLSGWPNPLKDGSDRLADWYPVTLAERGSVLTTGLPPGATMDEQVNEFRRHLRASLDAVHTNFAFFDGTQRLNWVAAWPTAIRPTLGPLPAALQPDGGGPPLS